MEKQQKQQQQKAHNLPPHTHLMALLQSCPHCFQCVLTEDLGKARPIYRNAMENACSESVSDGAVMQCVRELLGQQYTAYCLSQLLAPPRVGCECEHLDQREAACLFSTYKSAQKAKTGNAQTLFYFLSHWNTFQTFGWGEA